MVSANFGTEPSLALDAATLAKVNNPTASATGLPNRAYTDPAFFELEREKLFANTWTGVGQTFTIPSPGDARPIGFLGVPLLMIRNTQDEVRVFHIEPGGKLETLPGEQPRELSPSLGAPGPQLHFKTRGPLSFLW